MKNFVFSFATLLIAFFLRPAVEPVYPDALTVYDRIDPDNRAFPDYPFARPLAGGPLKVVFVGDAVATGLVCTGVVSRLDCVFESILTPSRTMFSRTVYDAEASPDPGGAVGHATGILEAACDVIWLDFRFTDLPDRVRNLIVERVRSGTGLVYAGSVRELTQALDVKKSAGEAMAGVYRHIRAERVGMAGRGHVFIMPEPDRNADMLAIGDWWSLAAGVFVLASGRETTLSLKAVTTPRRPVEHESMRIMSFRVDFVNNGPEAGRRVRSLFRNSRDETVAVVEDSYVLKNGKGYFSVRYPLLPAGDYSVDVAVLDEGRTVAVSGASFSVYSSDGIAGLDITRQFAGEGEFITGRVRMKNEIREGMALIIDLHDSWGNRISTTELIPDPRRLGVDFVFGIRKSSHGILTVRANLYKNNILADTREKPAWASGVFDPARFTVAVLDTVAFERKYTRVYNRLANMGTGYFALDVTHSTPKGAQEIFAAVSREGASAVPLVDAVLFGNDRGTGRHRSVSAGKAMLDTLSVMDVPSFILTSGLMPSGALRPSSVYGTISVKPDSLVRYSLLAPASGGGYAAIVSLPGHTARGVSGIVLGSGDTEKKPVAKATPWQSLFSGMNSVWWVGAYSGQRAAMAPGLVPNPCFQTLVDESRAVTGGIDRLLYGSTRLTDPVSIRFGRSLPLIDESKGEGGSSIDAKEVPVVTVSDSSGNIRKNMGTVLFKDGAAYYIGVVADPSVGRPESPEVSTLSVKGIDGEYHLYDVREKSYRSGMKATSFQAAPGDAFLFAMLPYRVREIMLKTDATVLSPGNSFSCQATVVTQDGRVPGRHVLSLEVLGPDGVPRSWLSDVLEARDGSAKITIPVSTGDTPGKWVVRVRDIASGKQSERVFIVMPPTGG